ncbi:hypothetical protein [Herbaspirillum sp. ST 5-3]|uniref:hypothetical protein n=1 Tax=Oxalobacteraceae TaxID=75682 RepID=UPI0010A3CBE4|nr:hypothetical protein [Herbaspirillum sp. ST 5-3]
MISETRAISYVSDFWASFPFGREITNVQRYQTFFLGEPFQLRKIITKIRCPAGIAHSNIVGSIRLVNDHKPLNSAIAGFVVDRHSVSSDWQNVSCSVHCDLSPGEYALVLGQGEPASNAAYEWGVGARREGLFFGSGNTPIIGATAIDYKDESEHGVGWMQLEGEGEGEIIDFTHSGTDGNGFGNYTDEVKRYQTFFTTDHCERITGIDLKIRKFNGIGQGDLTVELYTVAVDEFNPPRSQPNSPLASATIPSSSIGEDWTIVHAPLMANELMPYMMYAIVLGQRTPGPPRYEWAVRKMNDGSFFGKWNGSSWIAEPNLGDGWMKLWGHRKTTVFPVAQHGNVAHGFGNSEDEIKRFQVIDLAQNIGKALMGVDLRLKKYNGCSQTDITVQLYDVDSKELPIGAALGETVVPAYSIPNDWAIVHAPLWCRDLPSKVALVLSQREPHASRYEWATGAGIEEHRFGKWNGTEWVVEAGRGAAFARLWIEEPLSIIDLAHASLIGYSFGDPRDAYMRYQTIVPDGALQIKGVQLKLRKFFQSGQTDLMVWIYPLGQDGKPQSWPVASAVVESSLIGTDWTIVNVPISTGTLLGAFAVVVSQRNAIEPRYEWAVKEVNPAFNFGKRTGGDIRRWRDESGLGDGWVKIWAIRT